MIGFVRDSVVKLQSFMTSCDVGAMSAIHLILFDKEQHQLDTIHVNCQSKHSVESVASLINDKLTKSMSRSGGVCRGTLWMVVVFLLVSLWMTACQSLSIPGQTSIVTGANGYVGRAIVHELLQSSNNENEKVYCLVRPHKVAIEQDYWNQQQDLCRCPQVLPYDMLDGGATLQEALEMAMTEKVNGDSPKTNVCVYHVASVFGPTEDHRQTALDNVQGTVDLVTTLGKLQQKSSSSSSLNVQLVVTSSMAAVRASGQVPANGQYYTKDDWNTESELGKNWGESYQWSKMESEKQAIALARDYQIPMISLCPSFVFGPPSSTVPSSDSYSLTLVGQWARGESPVQSRLYVDVRDVATAHVAAGRRLLGDPSTSNDITTDRYILSTEARVPSQEIAAWIADACRDTNLADPDAIHYDADFQGGAIPIGEREVDALERLEQDLGVTLRPVKETIVDMTKLLLKQKEPQSQE